VKIPSNPFAEEKEDLGTRFNYFVIVVVGLFFILVARLWYLQIIRGKEFRQLSESNRTRVQDILPPRGLITDRYGEILVDNYPSFELAVVREDVPDLDDLVTRLCSLIGLSWAEVHDGLQEVLKEPSFKPGVIISNMNWDQLSILETHRYELPGVVIQVKPRRRYLQERLAPHVIGYLGEISPEQLTQTEYGLNRPGDLIGQCGVEQVWERHLHGRRGRRMVEIDASGRVLRVIKQVPPFPGKNLRLTLDARLQRAAQAALGQTAGAVVALDPNNGEILAMASTPTFNQNEFVKGISGERWRQLVSDPLHPLENRAISGQYPPGSIYKIVVAAAGLAEGVITPETTITCTGGYPFGNRTFRCWKKGGHGSVRLHRAIVESCDVYFYEVGRRLGVDRLAKYAKMFGLGERTGLGLVNEKPGLIPTSDWKKKRFGEPWYEGETISVAIGQGFNLVTPLQMAQVMAVAANGGVIHRPHLVKNITDPYGRIIKTVEPEVIHRLDLPVGLFKALQEALIGVVNQPGGTGRRAKLEGITVGGKTGTAQVIGQKGPDQTLEKTPYKYRDHAWFVACAPMDRPQIAVAVLAEHSGHGGSVAAPIAKQVLEAFFHPDRPLVAEAQSISDQDQAGD